MTWREILEGLAALPVALKQLHAIQQVGSVNIVRLNPGDAIVIETDAQLTETGRRNIAAAARVIWPDAKVAVFDSGFHMRIVQKSGSPEGHIH